MFPSLRPYVPFLAVGFFVALTFGFLTRVTITRNDYSVARMSAHKAPAKNRRSSQVCAFLSTLLVISQPPSPLDGFFFLHDWRDRRRALSRLPSHSREFRFGRIPLKCPGIDGNLISRTGRAMLKDFGRSASVRATLRRGERAGEEERGS
jgi:hypothetical protein